MQSLLKKRRDRKGLLLAIAGLLPLILCIVFTFINARQIVQRQQAVTASMLLTQAESISDQAWNMVGQLRQFDGARCSDIDDDLMRLAALYPYFRSIGVMQSGEVTCSSAFGSINGNLPTMIQRQPPEHRKAWWMLSIAGTYAVKDRPAVIFIRDTPSQFSTYAVVDGQYLLDFMHAVGKSHGYNIELQFGGGYNIDGGYAPSAGSFLLSASTLTVTSNRYPIVARVTSPPSDAALTWRHGLLTFMPMAVIFSLLLITVTNNWLQRKLSMRDQLQRAINHREFSVNYQPIYDIANQTYGGAEALMRWQLPNGSWVRPDLFIAAAESEEMIVQLTRHLMDLIAEDVQNWTLPPGFHLGVNVAAEHIQHAEFIEDIRTFAARIAMHQISLTLELTERSLISEGDEVVRKLQQLRSEGIRISIDDFGTGHCSLSYLQTFPLDYLKIDRGFVNAIESLQDETPVLDAIIMLSKKLKLSVVAEGVETPLQLAWLKARGVDYIQGYLYARPMTSAAMMTWIHSADQPSTSHPPG
ncbi:EAL domain-containing protein [Pantoea sp. BAV 3049]|uniref:EAL domain-containing protein n=1 Tax=Pantoea sp. BAV 3049 TaxID=2654188 RepID=UPI00131DC688|nr:EAL domain-containing protein [Pantoea sp. BAV 3049]